MMNTVQNGIRLILASVNYNYTMKTLYKSINNIGNISKSDEMIKFIISTENIDRDGDRVKQDWDLSEFNVNPIALFMHKRDMIVGTWHNLSVVNNALVGYLKLAKRGTSSVVDEVLSLIEQGILKAVSVGFGSKDVQENNHGGYDLSGNILREISLVSVPANADAIRVKLFKQSNIDFFSNPKCTGGECSLEVNNEIVVNKIIEKTQKIRIHVMTLSERIKELQKTITSTQKQLSGLGAKDELSDTELELMDSLTADIEKAQNKLAIFEKSEKSIGEAIEKSLGGAGNSDPKADKPDIEFAKGVTGNNTLDRENTIGALAFASVKSYLTNKPIATVAEEEFKKGSPTAEFIKASTVPADTTSAGWAAELVQQGYSDFLGRLLPDTIYGKVSATHLTFDKYGKLIIPSFEDNSERLAGAFVGELQPIPVKQSQFKAQELLPYKMAVISTFSKELFKRSTPNIEALLQNAITEDTRGTLDSLFLDATAKSTIRPAGLGEATQSVSTASTGGTQSDIIADVKGIYDRLTTVNADLQGVWLMHPSVKFSLENKLIATGTKAFPEVASGSFAGNPIATSAKIAKDKVWFISTQALVKANGEAMSFETNTTSTLVMADPAEDLVTGGAVTKLDVRSMFQTDAVALKSTMDISWMNVRGKEFIQVLSAVAW